MPYKKPKESKFAALGRLIIGYYPDTADQARILDCSPPTARKKVKAPELLTMADLDRLQRFGHIPADEIRECIVFKG